MEVKLTHGKMAEQMSTKIPAPAILETVEPWIVVAFLTYCVFKFTFTAYIYMYIYYLYNMNVVYTFKILLHMMLYMLIIS